MESDWMLEIQTEEADGVPASSRHRLRHQLSANDAAPIKAEIESCKALPPADRDARLGAMLRRAAASKTWPFTVRYILEHSSVDVNAADHGGVTALHAAALHGNSLVVLELLEWHADASRQTNESQGRQTAMHMALDSSLRAEPISKYRARACIRQLLAWYADPLIPCSKGRIPLHYAAEDSNWRAVAVLLDANPKAAGKKDARGDLPIHLAARAGDGATISTLLGERGCLCVHEINHKGEKPLCIFIQQHCTGEGIDAKKAIQALQHSRLLEFDLRLGRMPMLRDCNYPALKEVVDSNIHPLITAFLSERLSKLNVREQFASTITVVSTGASKPPVTHYSTAWHATQMPGWVTKNAYMSWSHLSAPSYSWVRDLQLQLYLDKPEHMKDIYPDAFERWLDLVAFDSSPNHSNIRPHVDMKTFNDSTALFVSIPFLRCDSYADHVSYNLVLDNLSCVADQSRVDQIVTDPSAFTKKYEQLLRADPEALKYGRKYSLDGYGCFPRPPGTRDRSQVTLRVSQGKPMDSAELDVLRSTWWPCEDATEEEKKSKLTGDIVVVDTLFLWVLGRNTVITCFNSALDGRHDWFQDGLLKKLSSSKQGKMAPQELAAQIMQVYLTRSAGIRGEVLLNFQQALDQTAELQTKHFKQFIEDSLRFNHYAKDPERHAAGVQEVSDALASTEAAIKNLCEVKDIREELEMIQGVMDQQSAVADEFLHAVRMQMGDSAAKEQARGEQQPEAEDPGYGEEQIRAGSLDRRDQQAQENQAGAPNPARAENEARALVDLIKQRRSALDGMVANAARTHGDIQQLLDLKQKQAAVMESRFARWQAESAARQGSTVLVFTVVTIVFLPASFMAAFFAIPGVSIPGETGGGSGFVIGVIVAITVIISTPLVVVASTAPEAKARLIDWMGSFPTLGRAPGVLAGSAAADGGSDRASYSLSRASTLVRVRSWRFWPRSTVQDVENLGAVTTGKENKAMDMAAKPGAALLKPCGERGSTVCELLDAGETVERASRPSSGN